MRVSIAILAYNEQDVIANMINSVFAQDIFRNSNFTCQFLVVANGCTDDTLPIAQKTIEKLADTKHEIRAIDLPVAGKSNAWNVFVHQEAWQDADYLLLVDADIEILGTNSLSSMVNQLIEQPDAWVSTDIPRKHIEKKQHKNVLDRFSLQLSKVNGQNASRSITGQLYCILGEKVREIHFPVGLPVEDGFLAAMIATENFTLTTNPINRVTVAKSASHYFEAFTNPLDLIKHEKRLMIGSTINAMVYNYLWAHVKDEKRHAGVLVRELNDSNSVWLSELIADYKQKRGFWFVPNGLCLKHINNWKKSSSPWLKKLVKLPLMLAVTFALFCLAFNVNLYFKNNTGIGHW